MTNKELNKIKLRYEAEFKNYFNILTVTDYVARYPNSEFSKKVKEQWQLKERETE